MTNRALDLYERSRPLDSLESFIFRTARRLSEGHSYLLNFQSVESSETALEFLYEIKRDRRLGPEEIGGLGTFAIAGALAVRAILTRKSSHLIGALQATSVALAFGGRGMGRLLERVKHPNTEQVVKMGLQGSQLYFKVGGEEVWVELAPVVGLTVRTFRFHWEVPNSTLHYAQIEMQDGRILTLLETTDSVRVRKLVHQLSRPVPVELSFQNIDLYREQEKISWEFGPRLVEPALN